MKNPKIIAITGASGGLGRALALYYAASGATLYLHGRDEARLAETAQACQSQGAVAHTQTGDVTDAAAMAAWIQSIEPIDLLIANAGVSAGTGIHGETADQAQRIFAVNIDGVVNSVLPALAGMLARKRGQIAIMSSLAGLRGIPSAPAYSASKNCVRAWGEALRGYCSHRGVEVSIVCPGYVRTPMTAANDFPMPFIMSAEKAAGIIASGLAKNTSRIAFPRALYWPMLLLNMLPMALTDPIFSRLPSKPSATS